MAEDGSVFQGEEYEWLVSRAKEVIKTEHFDYFIFGHRHLAQTFQLNQNSKLIYLGDWITNFSYGEWDGSEFQLKFFMSNQI